MFPHEDQSWKIVPEGNREDSIVILEPIADYACHTGENPLYHPEEDCVYWTDIPNGKLFRYYIATGKHEICYTGEPVGGFTLQADGALLLFCARGAVKIWRNGELTTVIDEIPEERAARFNDVIADPVGRVFCGTMPTPERKGRLYRLDTQGNLRLLLEGIGCSNGMGFTPDHKQMYYTDSGAGIVYLFDYDQTTGEISHQRNFAKVAPGEGVPDGMTVDATGNVWSTRWDGSCMVCYTPDGAEKERISFPVKKVSCVTFGDADYQTMYVTTAGGHIKQTDGEHAGALFRVRLEGVSGVPEFRSRVGR